MAVQLRDGDDDDATLALAAASQRTACGPACTCITCRLCREDAFGLAATLLMDDDWDDDEDDDGDDGERRDRDGDDGARVSHRDFVLATTSDDEDIGLRLHGSIGEPERGSARRVRFDPAVEIYLTHSPEDYARLGDFDPRRARIEWEEEEEAEWLRQLEVRWRTFEQNIPGVKCTERIEFESTRALLGFDGSNESKWARMEAMQDQARRLRLVQEQQRQQREIEAKRLVQEKIERRKKQRLGSRQGSSQLVWEDPSYSPSPKKKEPTHRRIANGSGLDERSIDFAAPAHELPAGEGPLILGAALDAMLGATSAGETPDPSTEQQLAPAENKSQTSSNMVDSCTSPLAIDKTFDLEAVQSPSDSVLLQGDTDGDDDNGPLSPTLQRQHVEVQASISAISQSEDPEVQKAIALASTLSMDQMQLLARLIAMEMRRAAATPEMVEESASRPAAAPTTASTPLMAQSRHDAEAAAAPAIATKDGDDSAQQTQGTVPAQPSAAPSAFTHAPASVPAAVAQSLHDRTSDGTLTPRSSPPPKRKKRRFVLPRRRSSEALKSPSKARSAGVQSPVARDSPSPESDFDSSSNSSGSFRATETGELEAELRQQRAARREARRAVRTKKQEADAIVEAQRSSQLKSKMKTIDNAQARRDAAIEEKKRALKEARRQKQAHIKELQKRREQEDQQRIAQKRKQLEQKYKKIERLNPPNDEAKIARAYKKKVRDTYHDSLAA
eukprot:m.293805 g.293805  ORF g.293805 m.293805 type:complete len:729 (-) comp12876_c0_seq1:251-2437(-)